MEARDVSSGSPVTGRGSDEVEEVVLTGGAQTHVVRVGDTVRSPVHPRFDFVQAVLRHLEAAGFDGAPRVRGYDIQGRQV